MIWQLILVLSNFAMPIVPYQGLSHRECDEFLRTAYHYPHIVAKMEYPTLVEAKCSRQP